MRRLFQVAVLVAVLCAAPAGFAQHSSIEFHGIPASVTSPRTAGTSRGIPASVTDPSFRQSPGFRTHGPCCQRGRHQSSATPVYAVPYYGYYGYPYYHDASLYDQTQQPVQQQAPTPQVIIIKDERSSADDESRYGEHEFDEGDRKSTRLNSSHRCISYAVFCLKKKKKKKNLVLKCNQRRFR